MKAAYIEQTGPPENIQVGDLPRPEPGPGQVLVRVRAVALNPIDLYIRSGMVAMPLSFPYVIGCDLAGTVEQVGPGRASGSSWATGSGGRTRGCSAARGWPRSSPRSTRTGSIPTPGTPARRRGRGDGPDGDHGPPRPLPVRPAQGGRDGLCPRRQRRRGLDGRADGQGGRRTGRHLGRQPRARRTLPDLGADLALNYKTDDVPARLREFAPDGFDVWYETQREPNLEVVDPAAAQARPDDPDGRPHGQARSAAGSLLPAELRLLGFAMFNASARRATPRADDINRWVEEGKLKPLVGRTFPLAEAVEAEQFLEDNTVGGAGTLTGKIVITID